MDVRYFKCQCWIGGLDNNMTEEAIVEIVDAGLIEDKQYASMGKNPADRVKTLLGRLHSITHNKQ